jgi:hypothetical protein
MALETMDAVNAALPGWRLPLANAAWFSGWLATGLPAAGVAPSSGLAGDVPTDATAGSIGSFVNPASGNTYLGRVTTFQSQSGNTSNSVLAIYDRLWHNSGIDRTLTTAQTINSVALTRPDANGENVEAWWEVYVTMGTGTPTVTLTYTDQSGNTGNSGSSGALTASMVAGRTERFTMAAGDTGVRSIQTWQGSATFGTVGTIGLVMRRPVALLNVPLGVQASHDAVSMGLPRIYDDACIEVLAWSISQFSTTYPMAHEFSLIQG